MRQPSSVALPGPPPTRARAAAGSGLALAVAALGVVYGDIGTSPLYALKECFEGPHSVRPTPENVLGVLSLVFWALTWVVSVKYLTFVLRADNRGEGGVLALTALVGRPPSTTRARGMLVLLGLFGAALLFGEGVITPAISVLGAVEGLAVAAPSLGHAVVPVTVAILLLLFAFQKRGTAAVGSVFGPIMLVWFLCIAAAGLQAVVADPSVLRAISPHHAARFMLEHRAHGLLVLGGVVLVVTGTEALYADMGHFGRRSIRVAWWTIAMPALVVNYFGQGALLLRDPAAARNPFYLLVPEWARYPMTAVATVAAVVASQALISGAFSITQQAVQLGYFPRVTIRHTSRTTIGQIYIPEVNAALGCACIAVVLGFRSASGLAAAYGIAVTGTMTITTLLFHRVRREQWGWSGLAAWPLTAAFLLVDVSFFAANVVKVGQGGWFPLAGAAGVFAIMSTWNRGRGALAEILRDAGLPIELLMAEMRRHPIDRIPGTAVFMTSRPDAAPPVLLHYLKHIRVLHDHVLLVSVVTEEIPYVKRHDRATVTSLGEGFHQVVVRYGFMQMPDVPGVLAGLKDLLPGASVDRDSMQTTYVLGRETLLPDGPANLARWRKRLFIFLARNAQTASSFFRLPPNRVVELGAQIQL